MKKLWRELKIEQSDRAFPLIPKQRSRYSLPHPKNTDRAFPHPKPRLRLPNHQKQ